jgi:hypothetical protein
MTQLRLPFVLLGSAMALLLCPPVLSQSTDIQCPSTVVVEESLNLTDLPGWTSHDTSMKNVHHFYGVAFSEGPPEKLVYQVPTTKTKTNKSRVDVFDLTSVSEDVWLSCLYRDTSQSLTQKLPKKFARCEVTYDARTGFRSVKKVSCF